MRISGLAETTVINGLAAAATGLAAGASLSHVARGLARYQPERGRMAPRQVGGVTLIDDSYNANPESMRSALAVLGSHKERRRIAVLGDMLELGAFATELHEQIGQLCGETVHRLYAFGNFGAAYERGAQKSGLNKDAIFRTKDPQELKAWLKRDLSKDDTVLFKGSRGMQMERFLNLEDEPLALAIAAAREQCLQLRVLGSFPAAIEPT